MNARIDPRPDDWEPADPPCPDVTVTDNPVIARILGPNGTVLREIRERPPIGFR